MNWLERWLSNPSQVARLRLWALVGLAVVALAEIILPLVFDGRHSHFFFEDLPAWGSLYGLVSCVLIIVVSKLLGKLWLMRREDYWD